MEQILNAYYADNAKKLHKKVDEILLRFGGIMDKDRDDFYSLANEVFADVINKYDKKQSFEGLLYTCLSNKIKSEMTRRNREKRRADRLCVSIDESVGDEEDMTLRDMIADNFDMEREVLEGGEEAYSRRMLLYLSRLSRIQKEVLKLSAIGYLPGEIKKELCIDEKQYSDCNTAIRSYRNISVLL